MTILQTTRPSVYYDKKAEEKQKVEDSYRYIAEVFLLELGMSIKKKY